jgi:stage III sporulation protein AB
MIKVVLSVIIIICTTMLGMRCSIKLKNRVRIIELLLTSLEEMRTNIAYVLMPFPQSFRQIAAHYPDLAGLYLNCISKQKNDPLINRAWKEAAEEFTKEHDLKFAEWEALHTLGEGLGKSDEETQLGAIEYTKQQLALCLKEAREKNDKLSPIFNQLGVAGGIMIVLLLV